jgi:hypothetical protein
MTAAEVSATMTAAEVSATMTTAEVSATMTTAEVSASAMTPTAMTPTAMTPTAMTPTAMTPTAMTPTAAFRPCTFGRQRKCAKRSRNCQNERQIGFHRLLPLGCDVERSGPETPKLVTSLHDVTLGQAFSRGP